MAKTLSNYERKRRMFLKMHNSISKKMNPKNIIWWNSLTIKAQYNFIFRWINFKKNNENIKLKHFIKSYKPRYRPKISNIRNAVIDHLIDE